MSGIVRAPRLNPILGWSLAAAAVVGGYFSYGWQGVVLAMSAVVFWLLLQFSRVLRALRTAAGRPMGSSANAVMLQAKLRPGMTVVQILPLTRSLGEKVADEPETFVWTDAGGDRVRVEMRGGRCSAFTLEPASVNTAADAPPPA